MGNRICETSSLFKVIWADQQNLPTEEAEVVHVTASSPNEATGYLIFTGSRNISHLLLWFVFCYRT